MTDTIADMTDDMIADTTDDIPVSAAAGIHVCSAPIVHRYVSARRHLFSVVCKNKEIMTFFEHGEYLNEQQRSDTGQIANKIS